MKFGFVDDGYPLTTTYRRIFLTSKPRSIASHVRTSSEKCAVDFLAVLLAVGVYHLRYDFLRRHHLFTFHSCCLTHEYTAGDKEERHEFPQSWSPRMVHPSWIHSVTLRYWLFVNIGSQITIYTCFDNCFIRPFYNYRFRGLYMKTRGIRTLMMKRSHPIENIQHR